MLIASIPSIKVKSGMSLGKIGGKTGGKIGGKIGGIIGGKRTTGADHESPEDGEAVRKVPITLIVYV